MKNVFLHFIVFLLMCYPLTNAQQNEVQRKMMRGQNKFQYHQNLLYNGKKSENNQINHYPSSSSYLTEFAQLPYQAPDVSYYEVAPVALQNGNIMMLWASWDAINSSDDTLFCATSINGGTTWGSKKIISHYKFDSIYFLTALQTNSGRILVCWTDYSLSPFTKIIYSDDNGDSWNDTDPLIFLHPSFYPSISESDDNTLYLGYSWDFGGYNSLVYRTSKDDGLTWSLEKIISDEKVYQNMGSVVPDSGNKLLTIYSRQLNNNWVIVKRSSSDSGTTWSEEKVLFDNTFNNDNSRIVRKDKDTLVVMYLYWNYGNTISDFYYSVSGTDGKTWSEPAPITQYAGYDGYVANPCLYNDNLFVAFSSTRWQPVYDITHVWYGILGTTKDDNPPPSINASVAYKSFFSSDRLETILANVLDESGIENVQVNISVNGGTEYSSQMFDDGHHNDWGKGDGFYGASVGPFSLGDHIEYNFTVRDVDYNIVNVQGFNADVAQYGAPVNPNGGFEETRVGSSGSDIAGWSLYVNNPAQANFMIVDDTVHEGYRSLQISVTNLGINDWDVQAVNEPFVVEPNTNYKYIIWAKADINNIVANFTIGDPSYYLWQQLFAVNLTTEWQEYSFDFSTPSGVNMGRVANHFGSTANSGLLPVNFYIDDLQIVKPDLTVGVKNARIEVPLKFLLKQNYPNPFNPSTVISYQLPIASHISLKVYDLLGREVATLVNEEKPAGIYEAEFNADGLSSGIYFYRIESDNFVQAKKMILMH